MFLVYTSVSCNMMIMIVSLAIGLLNVGLMNLGMC